MHRFLYKKTEKENMFNITMIETGTINSFDFYLVCYRRTLWFSISVKPHPQCSMHEVEQKERKR